MTSRHRVAAAGFWNLFSGVFTVSGSLSVYWAFTSPTILLTSEVLRLLKWFSYMTFFLMALGLVVSFLGINQMLSRIGVNAKEYASPPLSIVIATVLGVRKYYRAMIISALAYGFFYASVSSIIVYRPAQNFAVDYLATIPSVVPTVCCGGLGFIPIFTVYLTEHLGLLLIPANIVLMVLVSSSVGLNSALALYTYDHRPKRAGVSWLGGLGAATGLFTACPTCAGLFLGNLVQAAGMVAVASALAVYQPLFVAATFPLILASTLLITRRLRQALYGTCAVMRS